MRIEKMVITVCTAAAEENIAQHHTVNRFYDDDDVRKIIMYIFSRIVAANSTEFLSKISFT